MFSRRENPVNVIYVSFGGKDQSHKIYLVLPTNIVAFVASLF